MVDALPADPLVFEAKYTIRLAGYSALARYSVLGAPWRWVLLRSVSLAAIGLWALALLGVGLGIPALRAIGPLAALSMAVLGGAWVGVTAVAQRRARRYDLTDPGEIHLLAFQQGLVLSMRIGVRRFPWRDVSKVVQVRQGTLIVFRQNSAGIRGFIMPADAAARGPEKEALQVGRAAAELRRLWEEARAQPLWDEVPTPTRQAPGDDSYV